MLFFVFIIAENGIPNRFQINSNANSIAFPVRFFFRDLKDVVGWEFCIQSFLHDQWGHFSGVSIFQ